MLAKDDFLRSNNVQLLNKIVHNLSEIRVTENIIMRKHANCG